MFQIPTEPWRADAACLPAGVDMFDTSKTGTAAALAVCGRCPSLLPCRAWALDAEPLMAGCVIGGYSPKALKLARRARKTNPHQGGAPR